MMFSMKKFRIFLSSVQSEFATERRLLAEYIRTDALLGRFFDIFLFEEAVARDQSPACVYLGEVEQSDVYMGLLGSEFGYETESGVSATESEYDLATRLGKTRLVFIKSVSRRDPREIRFVEKVQGEVTRKSFKDFDSLRFAVYGALVRHLEQCGYVRMTPFDASFDTGLTMDDIDPEKVSNFFKRARMAKKLTVPPDASAPVNTPKPQPLTVSDTSTSSIPKRVSGLSEPKRSIASCHVMRGIGSGISTPSTSFQSLERSFSFASMTSSISTKESSISICVNSG